MAFPPPRYTPEFFSSFYVVFGRICVPRCLFAVARPRRSKLAPPSRAGTRILPLASPLLFFSASRLPRSASRGVISHGPSSTLVPLPPFFLRPTPDCFPPTSFDDPPYSKGGVSCACAATASLPGPLKPFSYFFSAEVGSFSRRFSSFPALSNALPRLDLLRILARWRVA